MKIEATVGVGPHDEVSSRGGRLRVSWEVTAGLVPRQPIPGYTRRWLLTSETYYAERDQNSIATFERYQAAARDYARQLENPGMLNWVKVEWLYL